MTKKLVATIRAVLSRPLNPSATPRTMTKEPQIFKADRKIADGGGQGIGEMVIEMLFDIFCSVLPRKIVSIATLPATSEVQAKIQSIVWQQLFDISQSRKMTIQEVCNDF